ncbi:MAG: substrate-binding domain-containing protein [Actinomycetes bacterium]
MRKLVPVVALAAIPLLLAACSSSSPAPSSSSAPAASSASAAPSDTAVVADATVIEVGKLPFDITMYCGTKPMVVGILDAYGGNGWAQGKKALLEKLSKSCPNVTDVLYVDANFDLAKYIAGVDSLVAQGANVIETFDPFGTAANAAFLKAQKAGVLVGNANAIPGDGTVPATLTSDVIPDLQAEAEIWVKWLTRATDNKGKIAYIGGPAGNTFDVPSLEAVKKAIVNQGSGIVVVTPEPVAGNWDPATTQQAMTGLLQKNPDINGVILTYTATGPAILRAYDAANLPYPALTGQSSSMEFVCMVGTAQKKDAKFQAQSLDGSPNLHGLDLAKLFAAFQGVSAPELGATDTDTLISYPEYVNSLDGVMPACDPNTPPSADLSTALSAEEMAAVFAK